MLVRLFSRKERMKVRRKDEIETMSIILKSQKEEYVSSIKIQIFCFKSVFLVIRRLTYEEVVDLRI